MSLSITIDGVDFTSKWRLYESRWTTRAHLGESAQGEFVIDDDLGDVGHPEVAARKIVEVWEDASGSPVCLYRGRIANKSLGRGTKYTGQAMRWKIVTEDYNIDLRGIRVKNAVRPAETDTVRVEAIRLAYLNGSSSTHSEARDSTDLGNTYILAGSDVNLLEETYTDTYPNDVLMRIAEDSGKNFFVYLMPDGTGELYYGSFTDTTLVSDISIYDDGTADSHTGGDVYAPARTGSTGMHDGQGVITGAGIRFGAGLYVEGSDLAGTESLYDKWEEHITNEFVEHTSQADNILNKVVGLRDEQFTYTGIIDMLATEVHKIRAGMMVELRMVSANKGTPGYQRAVQVQYEPLWPDEDGNAQYRVTVEMGRPLGRVRRPGSRIKPGPYPADPGGSSPSGTVVSGQDDDGNMDIAVTVGSGLNRMLGVLVMVGEDPTVAWHPAYVNAGTPGAGTALSLVDSVTVTGTHKIYYYRLIDPDTSTEGTSAVRIAKGAGVRAIAGVWSLIDVDQSTPETDTATNTGTGTTSSVTVTPGANDLVIEVAGWVETNATVTTPTEAGDNTLRFARTYDRTFGLPDYALGGADGSDATPSWNFTNSHPWGALAVAVKTTNAGSTTQPVGGTGDGTVGEDDGTYVGPEHVHEHGNITTGGPYHMAEDVTAADAGGYFTGTTVEAQLQELGAGTGSADDTALTRHAVHGTFLAAYHRASDQIPLILYSDDGITFRDGAAIHTALRDPSIMHWDGKFWATCTNSATAIVVFSSPDLETWTQIATPTTDGSGTQSWAPEWVRNVDGTPYLHPSTGLPCLTVNVSTDSETTFTVREMHPTNRAMTSWSATTTITGTGLPTTMIDGFLMADTDTFYLWFKDEANKHIEIGESSSLTSGYTLLESGDWAGWFAAKDAGANSIEGPCVIRLDDGRWRIYFNENNGLSSIRAVYSETTDDWRTGTSTWTTQASISTDALMSHGSVIFIPGVYDHQRDENAHAELFATVEAATGMDAPRWLLVTDNPGTGPDLVWEGDDLVEEWSTLV
jgi:hypothetical protein